MILFVLLCQIVEPYQCIPDRMPLEREITQTMCNTHVQELLAYHYQDPEWIARKYKCVPKDRANRTAELTQ
jgi:phage gpG-like protein